MVIFFTTRSRKTPAEGFCIDGSNDCLLAAGGEQPAPRIRRFTANDRVARRLLDAVKDKTMTGGFLQNFFGDSRADRGAPARWWNAVSSVLQHCFTAHRNAVTKLHSAAACRQPYVSLERSVSGKW